MIKKKNLLIMGGLAQQEEIILNAKRDGYHTIVIDNVENSPGKKIADESYLISITDVETIVKLCKERKVDGVMNYCIDPGQKPYQQVCEALGLPCYGTKEHFDILSNKDLFKETCMQYGVDIIPGFTLNANYVYEDIGNVEYPVVVKPADGRASKGITVCYSEEDLSEAIQLALCYSLRKIVNIEKYINKPELCAKYFVCNGEIFLTAFSDTYTHYLDDKRVYICGKRYPSVYYSLYRKTADLKIRKMIQGIGIKNGPLSFTGFYDDGVFRFFDPSFRMGGGQEWKIIAHVSGVDISNCLTNFAVTGTMGNVELLRKLEWKEKNAATLQLLLRPGTISKIEGLDEILKLDSIVGYHISHGIGDTISNLGTSDNVFMRILLVSNDSEQLILDQIYIEDKIKVIDDCKGENILLSTVKSRLEIA
jgi:Carbamoylphosphate synthase large subunit (split gene in MJ)